MKKMLVPGLAVLVLATATLAAPVPLAEPAAEKEVARLIQKLGDPAFEVREEAQKALLRLGRPALEALKEAARSTDNEVARRARLVLDEFRKQELDAAEVHVVGLYEARGKKAIVEVRRSSKPIILVLCAYESVAWEVKAPAEARLLQVIVSGYHTQEVTGADVPVQQYTYEGRAQQEGNPLHFYTFDHDEERYPAMTEKVRQLTGKEVASFQGRYSFKKVPFVVGGK